MVNSCLSGWYLLCDTTDCVTSNFAIRSLRPQFQYVTWKLQHALSARRPLWGEVGAALCQTCPVPAGSSSPAAGHSLAPQPWAVVPCGEHFKKGQSTAWHWAMRRKMWEAALWHQGWRRWRGGCAPGIRAGFPLRPGRRPRCSRCCLKKTVAHGEDLRWIRFILKNRSLGEGPLWSRGLFWTDSNSSFSIPLCRSGDGGRAGNEGVKLTPGKWGGRGKGFRVLSLFLTIQLYFNWP